MSGSLNHSPAHVIRDLLVTLGLGTDPDDGGSWPIFVSREPNTPDSVITLYDTASRMQGRRMVNGITVEHYGIQVRVRDAGPTGAWVKANALAVALDQTIALDDVTVEDTDGTGSSTYKVYTVSRVSGPLSLGKETPTSKRNLFTINAVAAIRQTA